MSKTNVSRCTIPTKKGKNHLYVKIKNGNPDLSRQFTINVYEKDSPIEESLPVYLDDQLIQKDSLDPGAEKRYKVDVSGIEGKVTFEIVQGKGGSGIKVSRNNKNPSSVEVQIK
jgi:hypothetical protein